MKQINYVIVILLILVMLSSCQQEKTNRGGQAYFISNSGNKDNCGSKDQPWNTLGENAKEILQAGDTLFFMGGETFTGSFFLDSLTAGTADKPVIITSYGDQPATINSGNDVGFRIEGCRHLKIEKLNLTGSGRKDGNTTDGMLISDCSEISVRKLDVQGYQKSGFHLHSSADVLVDSIHAHDNGFCGIFVSGHTNKTNSRDIIIKNSLAENNPGDPTALDNHSGNGILVNYSTHVTVEYCTATNNGWDMPRIGNGPVGIWVHDSDSILIQYCIACRNKTSKGGEDGGGFDLDGGVTNTVIQYCLSYANEGGGFGLFQYAGAGLWYNNTIRYCISENDGTTSTAHAGIYIWNAMDDSSQLKDCYVYNNVLYNEKGAAIRYAEQSKNSGFRFFNNIFVTKDSLITGVESGGIFLGNNWYSLSSDRAGIQEKNGLKINPQFKNPGKTTLTDPSQLKSFDAYFLPEISLLKTKGIDIHKQFGIKTGDMDFNGKKVLENGIGACQ